jgi:hypothetical protein
MKELFSSFWNLILPSTLALYGLLAMKAAFAAKGAMLLRVIS